jgi:hypothetical protein
VLHYNVLCVCVFGLGCGTLRSFTVVAAAKDDGDDCYMRMQMCGAYVDDPVIKVDMHGAMVMGASQVLYYVVNCTKRCCCLDGCGTLFTSTTQTNFLNLNEEACNDHSLLCIFRMRLRP